MSTAQQDPDEPVRLRIGLVFDTRIRFGPGKADLLESIRELGSIAAAGRAMSMSYKRAWSLVEEMNTAFQEPLVASTRGGVKGGGAHLTESGQIVLEHYLTAEHRMAVAADESVSVIRAMLSDMSGRK